MNIRSLAISCSFFLAWSLPAFAGEAPKRVWEGDARVQQQVAVRAEGLPVGELLAALSDKTGVSLSAAEEIADEKVILFSPARPLRGLLEDLAALLNGYWLGGKTAAGSRKYRLEHDLAARQYESRLARAETDRMLAQVEEQVRALRETPEQLHRRPAGDPVRRRLEDTRFGSRTATLLYSWLTAEQRELLFARSVLRLPFRSLTPDQQAAVRKAFGEIIARQQTEAGERIAERPGAVPMIGKPEDLDRFGITFAISRQSGYTSVSVKLGNNGDLSLATLNRSPVFLLPAHGNPYTAAPVPEDAPLPAVRAVTEAAAGDVPWPDRLRKLAEGGPLSVMADYYRTPPITLPPAAASAIAAPESPSAALDALCRRDGYLWWTRGSTLLLRKRDWYHQRLREVPDRWMVAMIGRLQAQKGIPTVADVMRLQELTVPQIAGLYLLAGQQQLDERFFVGVHDLLALVAAAPKPLQGPLPVGDFAFINDRNDPGLEKRISLIQDRLSPRQQAPFMRLLDTQNAPVPQEAMGGEIKVRFFCRSAKPQDGARGYRYLDVGLRWNLHRQATRTSGYGYQSGYDLYLPMSLSDDRRDHTRIEVR